MKWLVAPDEKRGRPLCVEDRTHATRHLLLPILDRALRRDAHVVMSWRHEKPVGVLESAFADPVDPNDEGVAPLEKGLARFRCRADEIGDGIAARLDHLIAEPTHPARLLNTVGFRKAKVFVHMLAHFVGIEVNRAEARPKRRGQRRLPRARKAHDQNLAVQFRSLCSTVSKYLD